jgi:monothiol glutaredoxin
MPLEDATRQRIQQLVDDHPVLLFMKGEREAPRCGFSASVVGLLDQLVPEYATADVLSDAALRDGIKEFSEWPTIPQLYVRGEFVGGCDIVNELFASGELHALLGAPAGSESAPRLDLTPAAAEVLAEGLSRAGDAGVLRLLVDARYRARIVIASADARDFAVTSRGVTLHVDPLSAARAEEAQIDVERSRRGPRLKVLLPKAAPGASQGSDAAPHA